LKITNKHNVPEAILDAARNDKYSKGDADISVTQLIDSPQISVLRGKHAHELELDISDRIWALLGTSVHNLLEHASRDSQDEHITEERLYVEAGGWTISGGIDDQQYFTLANRKVCSILDYKVTTALAVIKGKSSWEKQLNCYAYLVWKNKGIPVTKLEICAIIRDWSRIKSIQERDYPKNPIVVIDIPLWSVQDQETYILGRVHLHQLAQSGEDMPCTEEERWGYGEAWAAQKEGAKRATRLFDTEEEASKYAKEKDLTTVRRPPTYARCSGDYCQVNRWCKQWQRSKQGK
jgi:hypothetical protein